MFASLTRELPLPNISAQVSIPCKARPNIAGISVLLTEAQNITQMCIMGTAVVEQLKIRPLNKIQT